MLRRALSSRWGIPLLWLMAAILRTISLATHYVFADPFGAPIVARIDRFLPFHALVECGALAQILLPAALIGLWKPRVGLRIGAILAGAYLVWGQLDLEILRFFRQHATLSYLGTYLRPQAVLDSTTWLSLQIDPAGIARSVVLALAWLAVLFLCVRGARPDRTHPASLLILALASGALGTTPWWLNHTTNRIERTLPPTYVIGRDLAALWLGEVEPVDERSAMDVFRGLHLRPTDSTTWTPPGHPFLHMPLEYACQRGWTTAGCLVDSDGDGFDRRRDCDDGDSASHPGGKDIPSDGIDQDCSGMDSLPVNFVFLLVESFSRDVVGAIHAKPGTLPNLRRLESLGGAWYLRGRTNGFPSVYGVASTHLGLWSHPHRNYFTSSTGNLLKGFPEYFPDSSWNKIAISGSDPTFDNQMPWLRRWFRHVEYDPNNGSERSDSVIVSSALRVLDSTPPGKPYLLLLTTHTTHAPFHTPAGWRPDLPRGTDAERFEAALEYFDAQLGRLLDGLSRRPDFQRTVFLVCGDHGFPVTPADLERPEGLASERTATWIGVFSPDRALGLPQGRLDLTASQTDIGPTFLDLAGIRAPSHFQGRSLRDTTPRGALFFKDGQWEYHSDSIDLYSPSLSGPVWRGTPDGRYTAFEDSAIAQRVRLAARMTTQQIWVDSMGSPLYLETRPTSSR